MNNSVLECRSVSKTFKDNSLIVNVLDGIDFSVQSGEQIAIVGPSGSGKSTLLHILGGLDTATSGDVMIDGHDLKRISEKQRSSLRNSHLGFVYQFHHLLAEFTALENVCMPLLIRGVKIKEAKEKATELLDEVGLLNRLDHKPAQLSGGERQRTAIARALVGDPKCVLADEPTGNLDHHTAEKVYETMLELNQKLNTSILIVTHDLSLANRMGKVYELQDSKLYEASR